MSRPRPFDHLVLATRDLSGQAALYRRLGFQVGTRNQHPWGTQNHIIQLHGAFLELIGMGPGAAAMPLHPGPRQYSFGGFVSRHLAGHEGLAMLALQSRDAKADAAAYAALGIGDFQPFEFGRKAIRPNGIAAEIGFTLAFAQSPLIPAAGFFACQQHHPQNFWNAEYQAHPNTAQSVKGLVLVAENPADHAEFLSGFTGQRAMLSTSMGLEIDTGGGKIEVLTPLAWQFRYGEVLGSGRHEAHFAAFRVAVGDMARLKACLAQAGVASTARGNRILVAAQMAGSAAIVFEPA